MILLDSSILIDVFRKKNKQNTVFYQLANLEESFSISSITYYEVGVRNKKSNDEFWSNLYNNLTVIPFDQECSKTAIDIYLDLRKGNKLIDLADLLIGATALTHSFPLSTLNRKHFERINGIRLVGIWYPRILDSLFQIGR